LTDIFIPNSVVEIGRGALKNNQLSSVVIPNRITKIARELFENNRLTSVTIPGSVIEIELWAFSDNRSLTSITIPDSVKSIGVQVFGFGLETITIGSGVQLSGGRYNSIYKFDSVYNRNRKRTGTYVYSNGQWQKQ
jgi:hypothetical protein